MESLVKEGLVLMAKSGDPRLKRAYRDAFRAKILARDSYTCYYCGDDNANQVDHVIPISKAPELVVSEENAVACCAQCNRRKGNRSQASFLRRSATPPVFLNSSLPETRVTVPDSPFIKPDTLNFDAE
jgi:5-methylcytosine-specific restriction endonuclease McrA